MKRFTSLRQDERGAGALEFALVVPAFVVFVVGIAQLGTMFFANAGLHNAVSEGARLATIYPRPTTQQIKDKVLASDLGLNPSKLNVPEPVLGKTDAGASYYDLSMTYTVDLNLLIYSSPITLTKTRRVFLQPLPTN